MGKTLDNKNDDDSDENEDENDDGSGGDEDDKLFKQEEVDKIAGKARNQAKRKAERELLEALGVEDIEEAKTLLTKSAKGKGSGENDDKSKQGKDDDTTTEALKAFQQQIDDLKKNTKDEIAELKVSNRVEKALIKAGLNVTAAEKARKLVDIEKNADDDEIEDAIEELKEEMPELFAKNKEGDEGEDDDDDKEKPRNRDRTPHSNPGSSPRRRKSGKDVQTEARTLLHQRHPRTKSKET